MLYATAREHVVEMVQRSFPAASRATLLRRIGYGGRKGRAAARRLLALVSMWRKYEMHVLRRYGEDVHMGLAPAELGAVQDYIAERYGFATPDRRPTE